MLSSRLIQISKHQKVLNIHGIRSYVQTTSMKFNGADVGDGKKPKICINCKYFTLENKYFTLGNNEEDTKYAKCLYFDRELVLSEIDKSRIKNNFIDYLVTGIRKEEPKKEADWYYCSIARSFESMCGYEGKHYKDDSYDSNKEQI